MTGQQRLTRREVAERLGISVSSVRRLEGVGLHPVLDDDGVWRFDPAELERMPVQRKPRRGGKRSRTSKEGDAAARVFAMFGQGRSLRDIVLSAKQPPDVVRRLYREWLVGLAEGERARKEDEVYKRQRREQLEDERLHIEHMRALRT
jgi:hypothetical protein